jgi:hypothetical protein
MMRKEMPLVLTLFLSVSVSSVSAQAPKPAPPSTPSASTSAAPMPTPNPAERTVQQSAAKVFAIRAELAKKPPAAQKAKLKKALMHAEARYREASEAAYNQQLQKEYQAYVDKMMPIWQKQAENNVRFSIEAAKAQALQQLAITAEKQRQQDLWLQWQRNQIMADGARILQGK